MYQYIIKRLLLMIPTLFGAAVLVFLLLRAIPGDICELRMGGEGGLVDEATLATCRETLGLNEPLLMQFFEFVWGFFTLDLGTSMWTGQPIIHEIGLRFELSVQVAIMATIVSILVSIPLGTISAIKQDTWVDYLARAFSIAVLLCPLLAWHTYHFRASHWFTGLVWYGCHQFNMFPFGKIL